MLHLLLLWLPVVLGQLLHLVMGRSCVVGVVRVVNLSLCRLVRLRTHVLVMGVIDRRIIRYLLVLLVDGERRIGIQRLLAGLLQRISGAVGHLLGLIMRLRGQALDQLIVLLNLLLVVLHRLQLQIDRAGI